MMDDTRCFVPSSRRGGGSEPQAVGEQRCYLPHQRAQTRSFGLDDRQECVTIAVGKLMVVIQDLCRRLNRGDPVQHFLFRASLACTLCPPKARIGRPVAGQSTDTPQLYLSCATRAW